MQTEPRSLLIVEPPSVVIASAIMGRPLDYEWGTAVSRAIRAPLEDEHPRLEAALDLVPARAQLTLMAACLEWVGWRMFRIIPVDDAMARCEAVYVAAHDPAMAALDRPSEPFPEDLQDFHGPLRLARMLAADVVKDLLSGEDELAISGWVLSSALLARHLVGESSALFEEWLERSLRFCATFGGEVNGTFETQKPIARECLFSVSDAWTSASIASAAARELDKVDPSVNGYLRRGQTLA